MVLGQAQQQEFDAMIRVTVSYPAQENARFDHSYYQQHHAQFIHQQLDAHGLLKLEIDQCLADGAGKAPPIVAAAHLFFALNEDIVNYSDIVPVVTISQVIA